MKNVFGALVMSLCLAGQSYGAGLLDRMLAGGCGCDSCEPSCCCEKSCGCCDDPCCGAKRLLRSVVRLPQRRLLRGQLL